MPKVVFIYFNIIFKNNVKPRAYMAKDLSAKEAAKEIREKKPVIIDVTTPAEFKSGHIEGAVNMNIFSDFQGSVSGLDKSKTYFVYCRSGNRSRMAVSIMEKLGFKDILHLEGGIIEWKDEGLPVT